MALASVLVGAGPGQRRRAGGETLAGGTLVERLGLTHG